MASNQQPQLGCQAGSEAPRAGSRVANSARAAASCAEVGLLGGMQFSRLCGQQVATAGPHVQHACISLQ